jgi:hypothetical protein
MAMYEDRVGLYETFYVGGNECDYDTFPSPGWYWWTCLPGCLPDGEACGPFLTEQEARENAEDEELLM